MSTGRCKVTRSPNCNCDFGCPCQFNTLPTHGDCRAMTAVKIDKGHFGEVDLSGLAFCGMFTWPGAIHSRASPKR